VKQEQHLPFRPAVKVAHWEDTLITLRGQLPVNFVQLGSYQISPNRLLAFNALMEWSLTGEVQYAHSAPQVNMLIRQYHHVQLALVDTFQSTPPTLVFHVHLVLSHQPIQVHAKFAHTVLSLLTQCRIVHYALLGDSLQIWDRVFASILLENIRLPMGARIVIYVLLESILLCSLGCLYVQNVQKVAFKLQGIFGMHFVPREHVHKSIWVFKLLSMSFWSFNLPGCTCVFFEGC
jgi:hypothetical protein